MTISLSQHAKYLVFGALCTIGFMQSAHSQGAIPVEIYEGETYEYSFFSQLQATLSRRPSHGTAKMIGIWGNVKIVYTPDEGYLGKDRVDFRYFASWASGLYLSHLDITVKPHEMITADDYVITELNTPVTVDVAANDMATRGEFLITDISLVNNGSASIVDNKIVFVPNQDFDGTGYVTYIACDNEGLCNNATLAITVLKTSSEDTKVVNIKTAENTNLPLFLPNASFETFVEPQSGTLSDNGTNEFIYTPDPDFVGEDFLILTGSVGDYNLTYIYYIEVLEKPDENLFAKDDHVITRINQPITFDVLLNDHQGDLTIQSVTNAANGNLVNLGDGNFRFEPNIGFSGITSFSYSLGDSDIPNYESATVLVIVGNYNPASETFLLTTPRNTSRVLNYDVPITDFAFSVKDDPINGSMEFYEGYNNLTIQGQAVSGNNLLIYTPSEDFIGIDEFTLEYCVNGSCIEFSILMDVIDVDSDENQFCVDNCVWPGDANDDGIVDMSDLLTVGFAMGRTGNARSSSGMIWYGQFAEDWGSMQKNIEKDLKFADADGDGVITAKDTGAISEFYGLTHDLIPERYSSIKEVPIFFNLLTSGNTPGSKVEIEVSVGDKANPALDVYGLVFSIPYRASTIKGGSINMEFYPNSWLTYGSPVLTMTKVPFAGKLDAGFSRTNGVSVSNFGPAGKVEFVIADEIAGLRREFSDGISINSDNLYGVTSSGEYVKFKAEELIVPITTNDQNLQELKYTENHLVIYPNPIQDVLQFEALGDNVIENYQIVDITGKTVRNVPVVSDNPIQRADVSSFSNGVYFLSVMTNNGLQTKKFEILK